MIPEFIPLEDGAGIVQSPSRTRHGSHPLTERSNSERADAPAPHAPRIVADIGGTNGRFAIVRDERITERREYRNAEFADLPALVAHYLEESGNADDDVESACLAVAAPLSDDGVARFTNAPWEVSTRELQQAMNLPRVVLINDFAAQAYGLLTLGPGDVSEVAPGDRARRSDRKARVILGPGTGLGCAGVVSPVNDTDPPVAVTSEGGHMGFVVENETDRIVFDLARKKFGRVSWERVCCGAGLALVHQALFPAHQLVGVEDGDPSEVVKALDADGEGDEARSVRHYCGLLGAFAGDLALVFRAEGGVYLTGGVLAHLGNRFDDAAFLERFVAKGRYREWLSNLPVARVTADDVALRGCARYLEEARL